MAIKEMRQRFKRHEKDCGSSEVQIAILHKRIQILTEHMLKHKHDFSCKRGLLRLVHHQRRHLRYFYRQNPPRCREMIKELGIRYDPNINLYDHKVQYANFRNTKNKVHKNLKLIPHLHEQPNPKQPKKKKKKAPTHK